MKTLTKATALAYLMIAKVFANLSVSTQNAVRSERITLKKVVVYIRKNVTFGGTQMLVDSNTKQIIGVTNLEGNRLPAFRNIVFNAISLGYSAHADAGKEALLGYDTELPASLRNAEIEIKQDGNVICTVPCSEFDAGLAFASGEDKYVHLGGEYMIREDKQFEINLKFPDGSTGGGTNDYVEVRLAGIETSEK